MLKLNDLVVAGSEVFNLRTPPSAQALLMASQLDAAKPRRLQWNPSLLLHTLAVGGLPLGRKR